MMRLPLTCVVDASVGIQLFIPEKHSRDVQDLFAHSLAAPGESLFVPDLFFIECANILWKRVQRGEYPKEVAYESLADLNALELHSTPTAVLIGRAIEIACLYGITACDACYVALSERNNAPLITADFRLARTLSGGPFSIVSLDQAKLS
jgi:predicted nucleic acid-binding protein